MGDFLIFYCNILESEPSSRTGSSKLLSFHLFHFTGNKYHYSNKRDHIRKRGCVHNTVYSEKQGQYQHQRYQEKHLSCQRKQSALDRLSDSGEEIRGYHLHSGHGYQEKEYPHEHDGKFKIQLLIFSRAEYGKHTASPIPVITSSIRMVSLYIFRTRSNFFAP